MRVGFRMESDGSKVRVARHGGKELKVLGVVRADRDKAKSGAKASGKATKATKPVESAEKPAKAAKPKAKKA